MLDRAIVEQLREHFSTLHSTFTFALSPSRHPKQAELRELLEEVASTSEQLKLVEKGPELEDVRFEILKDGSRLGVSFRGIPGGHEFTSLILAVLNGDGKGRLPDPFIQARIRALRGPIELATFISLSCTNCPDIVQALNLMAILHGDLRHEMIDGELAPETVQRLGLQGVPAVVAGERLVHVGKATLAELLDVLETRFGSDIADRDATATEEVKAYDVVVVGGGPAGAAAAIYSARKGLSTAVVAERFGGQVQDTLGIENLISVTRTEGPKLAADLVAHLRDYPIELLEHRQVESIATSKPKKEIRFRGGECVTADAVIVATGAKWRELGVSGEKEYIGRGVAFCPHCDGPFYRGKRVAVVGGGNSGVEAAIDLAGICEHVTLVEYNDRLKADDVLVARLTSLPNVEVLANHRVGAVVGDGSKVTALRCEDRATSVERALDVSGVFVQIGLVPNSAFVRDLVETNRAGEIVVDGKNRTSVPGIYGAGDVTTVPYKQIVIAMAEGAKAALSAFEDRIRS